MSDYLPVNSLRGIGAAVVTLIFLLLSAPAVQAQNYDLLLKGGHLIDPANNIDAVMDVAITDGKVARVASSIPARQAEQVVDVRGLYVSPGFIDLHAHYYHGTTPHRSYSDGYNALQPDGFTFRSGVTTAVDVGGAGWTNFQHFKDQVIDRSDTRILAFVNIVGDGMSGLSEQNINDMDPRMTALAANRFREIVGVKIAHYRGDNWRETIRRTVEAGEMANIPVMVDFGGGRPSIEELFMDLLRPGDIFTHVYHPGPHKEPVVDANGRVKPFVFDAEEKGILFDVGHGGGSFYFAHAIPSVEQGLLPYSISTDIHTGSMNAGMKDQANVMSKFLNMGLSVQDVVLRSTWNPAKAIQREDLGQLGVGAEADIAVFNILEGEYGFVDSKGYKMEGDQKIDIELTLRAGRIVWDLNGLSAEDWEEAQINPE